MSRLLLVASLAGCYDPAAEPECTVRCTAPGGGGATCPGDLVCGDDFVCHQDGAPACHACLLDEFDGDAIDLIKWHIEADTATPKATITEENHELRIQPATEAGYRSLISNDRYDLTAGSAEIDVLETVPQTGFVEMWFRAALDADNYFLIAVGTRMVFRYVHAGVRDPDVILTYTPDLIPWRLRESGGDVLFEAGGMVRRTVVPAFPVTSMTFELTAGAFGSNPVPGVARFDGLRVVTPSCPGTSPF